MAFERFTRWARGLLGGEPPRPDAQALVMHLMGPSFTTRCGVIWSPANPISAELRVVTCQRCKRIGFHENIDRIAKRR